MSGTFLGHPRGLATLFFTEMWERFTYYGIRAVLVLFLVSAVASGGYGIDDKTATAIYGLYTAGTYLMGLPGGILADRLIGARKAVLYGGILITLGNVLLAIGGSPRGFYVGLLVIVLGVGLLKPNVSAMVAGLYPQGSARLDAGFTVFYMGINIGAALGPVVTGAAQAYFGLRAGFAVAALFMAGGVIQYHFNQHHLGEIGKLPLGRRAAGDRGTGRKGWTWVGLAAGLMVVFVAACCLGYIELQAVALARIATALMLTTAVVFFSYYLYAAGLTREEQRRGFAIVALFLGSVLFWSGYEQAGSSLNLFAERYTDRMVAAWHFTIPAEWFQSLNPVYIVMFAPLVAWLWITLARRALNPSAPAKFAIGVMLVAAGFLVMAGAAAIVGAGSKVAPTWLLATFLLHTLGELCLSPVGLSYVTKLAPQRFVGRIMGLWFLSLSLGNLLAGQIAGTFDAKNPAGMSGQYLLLVYCMGGLGLLLLAMSGPIKKLMGNVE